MMARVGHRAREAAYLVPQFRWALQLWYSLPGLREHCGCAKSCVQHRGPWTILCDNESFLRTRESRAAYRAEHVALWDLPPHSPDLNPVEMFWGWLRNKLRVMDLADLRARRPPLSKAAYVRRVQGVLRSRRAQAVASRFAGRLRKTCEAVVATGGAAARN